MSPKGTIRTKFNFQNLKFTSSSQILSPWLYGGRDIVDSGIGLLYTGPPGYKVLAGGPVGQPYARVDHIHQSGTKNLATEVKIFEHHSEIHIFDGLPNGQRKTHSNQNLNAYMQRKQLLEDS